MSVCLSVFGKKSTKNDCQAQNQLRLCFSKSELYTEFAVLVFFSLSLKDFFLFSFALLCFFLSRSFILQLQNITVKVS